MRQGLKDCSVEVFLFWGGMFVLFQYNLAPLLDLFDIFDIFDFFWYFLFVRLNCVFWPLGLFIDFDELLTTIIIFVLFFWCFFDFFEIFEIFSFFALKVRVFGFSRTLTSFGPPSSVSSSFFDFLILLTFLTFFRFLVILRLNCGFSAFRPFPLTPHARLHQRMG